MSDQNQTTSLPGAIPAVPVYSTSLSDTGFQVGNRASHVDDATGAICHDSNLWPETRLIAAQALVDELAQALARMIIERQPAASSAAEPNP